MISCLGCSEGVSSSQPIVRGASQNADNNSVMEQNESIHEISKTLPESSAEEVFKKRLLPILNSPKPSSCTECHLAGVELKSYLRPTQAATFAALVKHGMIDTENPDDSKILTFINRAPEQPSLITQKVREQESQAFRAWIHAAIKDPELLAAKPDDTNIGPQVSDEIIRHARKDRVLASFIENIWTEVARCAACHSPDQNQKQVKAHGEQVSWITLNDPQATLNYILDADLIDIENPEKSLLLQKPTLQVEHMGGQKMMIGDRSYKQFRRFIDDYSAIVKSEYHGASELPQPSGEVSVVTDIWLKIEKIPARYDGMLLQVDLYEWNDDGWSSRRIATSDRAIFGKGNLWQHTLSLTADRHSEWSQKIKNKSLPQGRYLAKVYIDQAGQLEADFEAELDASDLVMEIEFNSQWRAGYGKMTVIKFTEQ